MEGFEAKARERDEFERFARRVSGVLLRSASLLTRDHQDAEDLLQATLFRVARRWESIATSPDACAHRVLINLARDRGRHRSRRPVEALGVAPPVLSAVDDSDRVVQWDAMTALVRRLPAKQREVIVLRFFIDLSVQDVAAAMGCSEGTVKSHTSRALAAIRAAWVDADAGDSQMEVHNAE
ncbi:MAG: SigE family RNA polymerase sigma factor [Solirubrobacteraceae bacterium]